MPSTEIPYVYELTGPGSLLKQPDPASSAVLRSNEIRIESYMSAISPGTELAAFRGDPPLRPTTSQYPRLMGYCHVGRVTEVGPDTTTSSIGDLVLSTSAHRTHVVLPESAVLCRLHDDANMAEAATTYLFHLGYRTCLQADLRAGMSVAVIGLGTLGLTSAATASLAGATVAGFSNHPADSYDPEDFGISALHRKAQLPAGKEQFDVVVSTSNAWPDWELALQLTRPGGTVAVVGFPGRGQAPPEINPLASQYFYDKQLTLRACGKPPDLAGTEDGLRFNLQRNCAFLAGAILDGRLPAKALVSRIEDAKRLADVYAEMLTERTGAGTVILDWQRN